ncbi:hypothetical protein TPB0596_15540 [Tsukamurella pulmonis]|nr:hypothetical protein AXK56_11245 [Tsukamurella pulmonis]KXP13404.1 hypothetical protein AXK57_04205 [Tsukamurella pulmonis]RDH10635.1 hypothetical protein DVB88_16875 [Tsukamurella pulmonis]BDD81791.1 hypothetical protein TPB0596_15540 [Tsukamurella pulmonis]
MLPDDQDTADFGGVPLRKGTVAAFVRNAQSLEAAPEGSPEAEQLVAALADAVPQLRAIGVLDVFAPVSPRVRAVVDAVES